MPSSRTRQILHQLRATALAVDPAGSTDGQLLECFLTHHDEAAFAALLRRHGPMVLGVCRRVVGNLHDAEDAFQATFLVLVRKAASIVPREAVGNWLYGVAYRTALEARTLAARRRAREKSMPDVPHPAITPEESPHELRAVLDHELSRLPEKYRLPVVLCELEGKSRKEVARQLNLPEGTLSSRLATARRLLAGRLARRGLALSGAALTAALAPSASAAPVPLALLATTFKAATLLAAGHAPATVLSARVAALTHGVLKAMLWKKLTLVLVVVLALGLAVSGALFTYQTWAADAAARPPLAPEARNPAADRPGTDKDAPKPEKPADEHTVQPQALPQDDKRVWTLDFRFKDLRSLSVDLPGKGKKTVWYLCYEVLNTTDEPRIFLPEFLLVTGDKPGMTADVVLPKAQKEIAQVEDATQLMNFKNSVTIATEPLPPAKPKTLPRGVWGVATWVDLDPQAKRFTLFVSGLSNGWTIDDNQVIRRKVLRLDFKRVDNQFVFVAPPQWVYRSTQPDEAKKKDERDNEVRQLERGIDQVQGAIELLDQQQLEWNRSRERLQMQMALTERQLAATAAADPNRRPLRAEIEKMERQRADGDFADGQREVERELLKRRLKALEEARDALRAGDETPPRP